MKNLILPLIGLLFFPFSLLAASGDLSVSGNATVGGLPSAATEDAVVCFDNGTGQLGKCPTIIQGATGPQGPQGVPGMDAALPGGIDPGDMQYWDGTAWVLIPAPVDNPRTPTAPKFTFCEGKPTWSETACRKYTIGDRGPAGGIVFYITNDGFHGLEAARTDQNPEEGTMWGCDGDLLAGADGTAIGTSVQNTQDILADCMNANIAAEIADEYVFNGYEDWFLPSKDVLDLLHEHKDVVGGFAVADYWSSSQFDSDLAWSVYFNNLAGPTLKSAKFAAFRVRAVREF